MMNNLRKRLGSSFIGAMMSMALSGISSLTPFSPKNQSSGGMAPVHFPSRKPRPAKRKGYRTTKAEGVYGANLRAHFDKKRLTRSERNKFYAGKAI